MSVSRRLSIKRRVFFMVIVATLLCLLSGDAIPYKDYFNYHLGDLTSHYAFDFVGWEINSLTAKLKTRLVNGDYAYLTEAQRQQVVADYFATASSINDLDNEITKLHAEGDPSQRDRLTLSEQKLAATRQHLAELDNATEAILASQIAAILAQEDIGESPLGIFPPVLSEFERLPLTLVVSPREKIEIKTEAQLRPDLDLHQIEVLESAVDGLGVSSLVVTIGGLSTYPGMVMATTSRDGAVHIMAHEWFHDYLFLHPLGQDYGKSHELIAINETVADIASQEIGGKVLERFYGVPIPPEPAEGEEEISPLSPDHASAFDYNREMRITRLTADALLAQGQIAQAEQYMEERRRFFLSKGYVIRKLNQAYFAFYGSYADSPISVDPIGRDLHKLRRQVPTLKEFISVASRLTSYEDLKKLIH